MQMVGASQNNRICRDIRALHNRRESWQLKMQNRRIPTPVVEDKDDNALIIERIKQRLEIGLETYGHGVRIQDDTKQYGTQRDDWAAMSEEEILDGLIYAAAAAIKQERIQEMRIKHIRKMAGDLKRHRETIDKIEDRMSQPEVFDNEVSMYDALTDIKDILFYHLNEEMDDQ